MRGAPSIPKFKLSTTQSDGRLQNPGDLWHEMRTDSLAVTAGAMTTSRGFGRAIDSLAARPRTASRVSPGPSRPDRHRTFAAKAAPQTPSGASLHDVTVLSDTLFGGNRRE